MTDNYLPLVEEATCFVKVVKKLAVSLTPQKSEVTNLKIAPEMAQVITIATIVGYKIYQIVLWDQLRILLHK